MATLDAGAERLLRELAPQVLGAVVRRCGDFAAAEDAVQEALIAAGEPVAARRRARQPTRLADPGRAARRMTDHVRSETARRRRESVWRRGPMPRAAIVLAPDADSRRGRSATTR